MGGGQEAGCFQVEADLLGHLPAQGRRGGPTHPGVGPHRGLGEGEMGGPGLLGCEGEPGGEGGKAPVLLECWQGQQTVALPPGTEEEEEGVVPLPPQTAGAKEVEGVDLLDQRADPGGLGQGDGLEVGVSVEGAPHLGIQTAALVGRLLADGVEEEGEEEGGGQKSPAAGHPGQGYRSVTVVCAPEWGCLAWATHSAEMGSAHCCPPLQTRSLSIKAALYFFTNSLPSLHSFLCLIKDKYEAQTPSPQNNSVTVHYMKENMRAWQNGTSHLC